MPSQLPTTFASAAATNGASESTSRSSLRGDVSGDWSRARTNGATQTFRRPSLATTNSHQRDGSQSNNPSTTAGVYVPPHLNSNYQQSYTRNSSMIESRYSKDQLLDLYRAQGEPGSIYKNASEHLVEGWNPGNSPAASNGSWNRRDEHKDAISGPEICWDYEGSIQPLGLSELSDEEKENFSSSVNSPLKPPPQSANKEGTPTTGTSGRKASISTVQSSGTTVPIGRPGPRRRETSDSLSFSNPLVSPVSMNRNEEQQLATPSPSLVRRRTDFRDSSFGISSGDRTKITDQLDTALDTNSPFGSFKRTGTGPLSAGGNGPLSPWSTVSQSTGFPSTGAFGSFSLSGNPAQPPTPGEKKSNFGGIRAESRFKGLMSQDSSDEMSARNKDKLSHSNLEKLPEIEIEQLPSNRSSGRAIRQSTESNPFDEPDEHVGSAALGGDVPSPPAQHPYMQNQPDLQRPHDDIGFSAFGAASDMSSFRDMMHRREYNQQQTPQSNQYPGANPNEPMSPTNTNPYQSPEGERTTSEDLDTDGSDAMNKHQNAYSQNGNQPRPFNANFEGAASDRSQTSSAGPSRGFPNFSSIGGIGGIGTSGGWSAAPGIVGTPVRSNPPFHSGFGDSIFSSFGDIQSPIHTSASAFGNPTPSHFGNVGTIGRGSKMGSLFPLAMQDQMRGNDSSRPEQGFLDSRETGVIGRSAVGTNAPGFGAISRETDSPSRQSRGMLDDLFGNLDGRGRGLQGLSLPFQVTDGFSSSPNQGSSLNAAQTSISATSSLGGHPSNLGQSAYSGLERSPEADPSTGISSQLPATQQRQMVMPDRMRWIYRDPQGNTQGPWSGLEMHDWYKAGFFSPELQVKKLEDSDYEPLAQLIRRIGNSREPFLVPQIGIPHGSASTQPPSNASVLGTVPIASTNVQSGSAQPPFAGSFPSFGTTLTAEQQNALERRKQEEQYLMARQKEHLAQQQVMIKQMQHMQGGPHSMHAQQLHHHSSAHSLQSQPSYGSITSPTGYQPLPAQTSIQQHGGVSGFFESSRNSVLGMGTIGGAAADNMLSARDSEMAVALDRLNVGRNTQLPYGNAQQPTGSQETFNHQQQVMAMLQDRARLQREQEHYDLLQRASLGDSQETMSRLEQYHQLRARDDDQMSGFAIGRPSERQTTGLDDQGLIQNFQGDAEYVPGRESQQMPKQSDVSSAAEQVAILPTSSKQLPPVQTQSPWAAIDTGLPMPFPPPQSASPLPAPAAQRNRQNVADALAAESRSRSQTPSIDTPSAAVAPWAKENFESSKGPSLKEIQESEARQTAQQEELAAAARRALAEQERQNQTQLTAATPGLPSSANWASGGSPATPTSGGASAWAKPLAGKQSATTATSTTKKTLAQIQKEEEARKSKVAAAATAANTLSGIITLPSGKRYADLAGKVTSPNPSGVGGAWTTVGAGGKLKPPLGTPSVTIPTPRTASGGSVTAAPATAKSKSMAAPVRSNTAGGNSSGQAANDELYKWAKGALVKGLKSSINVDDFVRDILQFPSEPEILSEAVYANSQTLDGRRFAEEFIRRRKLADKGIVPEASAGVAFSTSNGSESKAGGGWSEVAKKGPGNAAKDEPSSNFKVVVAKKKAKRSALCWNTVGAAKDSTLEYGMMLSPLQTVKMPSASYVSSTPIISARSVDDVRPLKVIGIGAGISGILAAIRVPEKLKDLELVIYDKNEEVGGTWFENRYPGCACDIPAHCYQLSFESNPSWSSFYARAPEILAYWKRVVEKYGVRKYMKLSHKAVEARWDEKASKWRVRIENLGSGEVFEDTADALLTGIGVLNEWKWPSIPGIHDFKGKLLHSAQWDRSYDYKDQNVAVIGAGSSGIQIVPNIQPDVQRLDHYVRGKTWIATTIAADEVKKRNGTASNFDFTKDEIDSWLRDPELYLSYRKMLEAQLQSGHIITVRGSDAQVEAKKLFTQLMNDRLTKKPEVAEHMIPDFPPLCKRLTPGPGYLESLTRENVNVIPTAIERITATGIQTTDGKHREVDAIVCATGFDTSFQNRFPIYGIRGIRLGERWKSRVDTYLSMMVDGYPNFFMSLGPNSGLGSGNLLMLLERMAAYSAQMLHKLQTQNILTVQPTAKAVRHFTDFCDAYFAGTVYSEECSSWYKGGSGKNGRVVALWPGSSLHAIKALESPRYEDFEYTYVDENPFGWFGDGWSSGDRQDDADRTYYLDNQRMIHESLEERAGVEGDGWRPCEDGCGPRERCDGEARGEGILSGTCTQRSRVVKRVVNSKKAAAQALRRSFGPFLGGL
ncbi:hypothetical protein MMC13_006787 [Lambiella insularis]|nr:hypothetical protein [Lambiella insularis]